MQTLQAIHQRRTAHRWRPAEISEQELQAILQAGHMAPCHKLTWPWRFHVAGPKTRQALFDLAAAPDAEGNAPSAERLEIMKAKLLAPAALIVLGQALADTDLRRKEDYAALSCAQQNMALAAWDMGWASKWSTTKLMHRDETYALFGIDPQVERIEGFFWIGKPATVPQPKRPAVDGLVTRHP